MELDYQMDLMDSFRMEMKREFLREKCLLDKKIEFSTTIDILCMTLIQGLILMIEKNKYSNLMQMIKH